MPQARWIDLGLLAPAEFHASYAGFAAAQGADAAPAVLWGRAEPHLCIGQHQDPGFEAAAAPGVPVIRRALGGGAVWVDPDQWCWAIVAPRRLLPPRPAQWFGWALKPAAAAFRAMGLAVERVERDLWFRGRKIAGSGAASVGACGVVGSSFMLRFPAARFAEAVRSPNAGFRRWLEIALEEGITDWASHAVLPDPHVLRGSFRAACTRSLGWEFADSGLAPRERAAAAEHQEEMADMAFEGPGRRTVPGGLRINARTWLVEHGDGGERFRVLLADGRLRRTAVCDCNGESELRELAGLAPRTEIMRAALAANHGPERASRWARQLQAAARQAE